MNDSEYDQAPRRRGRPPASEAVETTAVATENKPTRRRRASVGGFHQKLAAPKRNGFTGRWVNDDGNRIAEMQELGYDFATETEVKTDVPGSRIARLVGTKANGEPLHAYLMRTPDELYADGMAEREEKNRQIDDAINAGRDSTGRLDNQYGQGSVKIER